MDIAITGKLPRGFTKQLVRKLVSRAYRRGGGKGSASIGVAFVSEREIRRLNRVYRRKDKVTDVLSFASSDLSRKHPDPRLLGDIIVCSAQVRRQAKRIGRPARQEFALMLVHGTLHLLGYDHESVKDEKRMFGLQQDILIEAMKL